MPPTTPDPRDALIAELLAALELCWGRGDDINPDDAWKVEAAIARGRNHSGG